MISRIGLAVIDKKERYLASYPAVLKALQDATLLAKRERLGMYELGLCLSPGISCQMHLLTRWLAQATLAMTNRPLPVVKCLIYPHICWPPTCYTPSNCSCILSIMSHV